MLRPHEGDERLAPRLHASAHRRSSRADGTAIRGAAPRGACPSTAETKGTGASPSLSIFSIARTRGLAARLSACRILAGRGQNRRTWEERHACVVVDVWVTRVRRTGGGTRGAVAGTRHGGAGVRAAGRRGAAGPCRRAAGAGAPDGAWTQVPVGGGPAPARCPRWSPRSSTRSPRRTRDVMRWWRPA